MTIRVETVVNTRDLKLIYPHSGGPVELDLFLPQLSFALEFQDRYHYETTWYNHNSRDKISHVDSIKRDIVQSAGITLVDVPCWWDGDRESLVASILFQRPDFEILENNDHLFSPIPLNPPLDHFQNQFIPNIGELMLASFPVENKIDISSANWWIGEKYDGMRCCWNPGYNTMYTRTGKQLELLPEIISHLPVSTYLDGEFWFGRGLYSFTPMLVVSPSEVIPWHFLKLIAFDNPSIEFRNIYFEDRYKSLLASIDRTNPFCIVASRVKYKSDSLFNLLVESVIHDDGEGVILRKEKSFYEPGRTPSLIKIKTVAGDKEGIVVEASKKGVKIQLPDKTTFKVAAEDVLIPQPRVGEVVTFTYERTARRGTLPLGPKVVRVRTDLTWGDVVRTAVSDLRLAQGKPESFTTKPIGYWNQLHMRKFLEDFAKERDKDPLSPDTWYTTSVKDIIHEQSGSTVLRKLKGYRSGLETLFPEISFDNTAFPLSSWTDITKRREFFEEFAKEYDFDPLLPNTWYHLSFRKLMSFKGAATVISYHNNSISQALVDIFPNIGLQVSKIGTLSHIPYFQESANRKMFFETYASRMGFDPQVANNWYSQKDKILSSKGSHRVLGYHDNSVSQALLDLFPELWNSTESRRRFFEEFATMNHFDAIDPIKWYSIPRSQIMAVKGASTVVKYHNDSVTQALMDLFPDIGFHKDKFSPKFFKG